MEGNTQTVEKAYKTKEVAVMLGIAAPTVMKYAQNMERVGGYEFIRSESGARLFVAGDIEALRYLTDLRAKTTIKVEEAVRIVVDKMGKSSKPIQTVTPTNTAELKQYETQYNEDINELKSVVKELVKKIDDQQQYIENHLKQRDEMLLQAIREIKENKQQLRIEESQHDNNKQNKPWWKRMFK